MSQQNAHCTRESINLCEIITLNPLLDEGRRILCQKLAATHQILSDSREQNDRHGYLKELTFINILQHVFNNVHDAQIFHCHQLNIPMIIKVLFHSTYIYNTPRNSLREKLSIIKYVKPDL